jgi:membrane protein implicated in regulation of membrane protease activity
MEQSTIWWLLTGVAILIELMSGTFYLLMLATGLAAAAVASHLGATDTVQIAVAALISSGAVLGWRAYKISKPSSPSANANPDVNLDVGATVQIDAWNPDGTASVKYRGANWTVAPDEGHPSAIGAHRVVRVLGSRLIVRKIT